MGIHLLRKLATVRSVLFYKPPLSYPPGVARILSFCPPRSCGHSPFLFSSSTWVPLRTGQVFHCPSAIRLKNKAMQAHMPALYFCPLMGLLLAFPAVHYVGPLQQLPDGSSSGRLAVWCFALLRSLLLPTFLVIWEAFINPLSIHHLHLWAQCFPCALSCSRPLTPTSFPSARSSSVGLAWNVQLLPVSICTGGGSSSDSLHQRPCSTSGASTPAVSL